LCVPLRGHFNFAQRGLYNFALTISPDVLSMQSRNVPFSAK
jgi:hypothetical protein